MKLRRALAGLLASTLLISGCSSSQRITSDPEASAYGTIQISTGISDETAQVAAIYAHALQRAGYTVELVDTGTTRADYLSAMGIEQASAEPATSPSSKAVNNDPATVDMAVDYSGNLLLYLTQDATVTPSTIQQSRSAQASPSATDPADSLPIDGGSAAPSSTTASPSPTGYNITALSENDILNGINQALPQHLRALDTSGAENRDSLVITQATAARYKLSSLQDLAEVCDELTFGASSAFHTSAYGLKALQDRYGCTPKNFIAEENQTELTGLLAQGTVDVADIYSASSAIDANDYVVLTDPDSIFIPQQITPIVSNNELPSTAKEVINTISSKLTTDDLTLFNQLRSGSDAISKENVAEFWLDRTTE